MVLVVLRIREGAKVLKPWYACAIPETATLTEVYLEFSSGLLDNSSPLPQEYRTTSVEATIGRSSSNVDTNISCSIKVGDAVSLLGNYIEYVVSKTPCVDEEASNQSGTKNAFSILMETAKIKTAVPDKKLETGNKKNQLKNDVIDFLVKNKLGWDPAHAASIGCTFVNTVSDSLWYINGNFSSLSSTVPGLFQVFQGYNRPELHKKRKRDESNLKATELTAYSNSLFTLAGMSYMKTNRWKDVNKAVLDLANNLRKYATYLEQKNVKMRQHHKKRSWCRSS